VLIVHEGGEREGGSPADSARVLETLIAHFQQRCQLVSAPRYQRGLLRRYRYAFYLAGAAEEQARAQFAADLGDYEGTAIWVGPGVQALGESQLRRLGLESGGSAPAGEPATWVLSYRGQRHRERLPIPSLRTGRGAKVVALAQAGERRQPFLVDGGRLWYAAAGPQFGQERFWSLCIWSDALHDMLGLSHPARLSVVPVLRDVPVWVSERQVTSVIEPVVKAGVPVSVLAATRTAGVLLSARPAAVRGLRRAESLGATVTLTAGGRDDPRESLHTAWEVGLHPIAWAGSHDQSSPFRLRIAPRGGSPPYSAGGLLPAPVPISDAGYISAPDAERLEMQRAVRDAVALVSFGLWAPAEPFLHFLAKQKTLGWTPTDLRDLGVLVTDSRRVMLSGEAAVQFPPEGSFRKSVLSPRWQTRSEETLPGGSPARKRRFPTPAGCVTVLERVRPRPARPLLTGVTLDPWSYGELGVSAKALAEALAERYLRNGVNTVFFYAYNVEEGAAYRTRYQGASVSAWGRQDLLGHLLAACRTRGIRVVAWLYSGRDRGAWLRHPEWRERTADGKDYNPLRLHATYFLCPRNPQVQRWYAGLLRDLGRRYPTLDGIELCEPLVNWWGEQACHCQICRRQFAAAHPGAPEGGPVWRRFRAEGLTHFLSECVKAISEQHMDSYIMTITDAWSNGAILSPREQADESGFDLDALLDGPHPPDWVNFELIWQQWAALYGEEVFNPEWAAEIARQLMRRTDGRARVIFHLEMTDFGSQHMTPAKIADTISRVRRARPAGIECYHSTAIDQKSGWSALKRSYQGMG
jgi:hypothetical protein